MTEPQMDTEIDRSQMTVSDEVAIEITNRAAFIGWVLGFTDQAEVLGPSELRRAVIDHIAGAA